MKATTKILFAAAFLTLPTLGACDASPTGPVIDDTAPSVTPQMGLGTSPRDADGKGGVIGRSTVRTKSTSSKGGIIS
jgi:hypothetical protein